MGHFFVVAAPSGAGKTSLVRALSERIDQLKISISYTTRPPRPGDISGQDYYFVDTGEFTRMVNDHDFLEHATIYHHQYGTSRAWVLNQLAAGIDVLLEIDWQGAQQIRQKYPETVLIFIMPPSLEVLNERLQNRRQDTPEIIAERMAGAQQEMAHYQEFDYLVINDKFEQALTSLQHIVWAERLRCAQQVQRHADILDQLGLD